MSPNRMNFNSFNNRLNYKSVSINKSILPFLDMLKFKCKNGCNVELQYSSYKNHITNCPLVYCTECKIELNGDHDLKACKDSMIDKMLAFVDIAVNNSNSHDIRFNNSNRNLSINSQSKMITDYKSMGSRDAKLNYILTNINVNNTNNSNQPLSNI